MTDPTDQCPRNGARLFDDVLQREFVAHRRFWVDGVLALVLAALIWPFIVGDEPLWRSVLTNLAWVASLVGAWYGVHIWWVWRSISEGATSLDSAAAQTLLSDVRVCVAKHVRHVALILIVAFTVLSAI